jgi:hypothetical protein
MSWYRKYAERIMLPRGKRQSGKGAQFLPQPAHYARLWLPLPLKNPLLAEQLTRFASILLWLR